MFGREMESEQASKKFKGLIEVLKSIEGRFSDTRLREGLASFARLRNRIDVTYKPEMRRVRG
jgi:hypothetical protein